jgi:acetyl-CoA carboxylase biotin carboxyl carrier protein
VPSALQRDKRAPRELIPADPDRPKSPENPTMGFMSHTVTAELVAAVMKVEVEVGQSVAADDAVVILESMKMEIPVLAEVAGRVAEISVAAGDVVNDGDPLVVITPSAR